MEVKHKKVCAIIVAAGSSSRMAAGDKMFISLSGKPVLARTLTAFENNENTEKIIVVTRKESIKKVKLLSKEYGITKLLSVVEGGKCRAESVLNGVNAAKDYDIVLIHDGARPLISNEIINRVIKGSDEYGAAIPTVAVKDTVKTVDGEGFITSTPKRSTLFAAETPQGFLRSLYIKAADCEKKELDSVTDDASLFELAGYRVKTVEGDYKNIKITTDSDLAVAENYLNGENRMESVRIGHGYDVHKFAEGRKLIIGGVEIEYKMGLLGHSDADVLLHAVADAILGAAALGDIGKHFPDTDPKYKGIDSRILLRHTVELVRENGFSVSNVDCTVVAQKPKLLPFIDDMRKNIAEDLGMPTGSVNVKATTEEGLGFTGEEKGISAHAVCILCK